MLVAIPMIMYTYCEVESRDIEISDISEADEETEEYFEEIQYSCLKVYRSTWHSVTVPEL